MWHTSPYRNAIHEHSHMKLLHNKYKPQFFGLFSVSALALIMSACQSQHHYNQSAALPAHSPFSVEKQQFCADFLSKLNKKPLQLTFEGCSAGFYADHHSVIANYRVSGKHAFDVQEFLHDVSGMPRLVKDCCSWKSINPRTGKIGGVIRENGETYFVHMEGDELRLGWGLSSDVDQIPAFRVQAIYPLKLNLGDYQPGEKEAR